MVTSVSRDWFASKDGRAGLMDGAIVPELSRFDHKNRVALGLAASVALSRVLEGTLFGISALDPQTYALVPLLLLTIVAAASSVPAWRATRVPAISALRGE
jgi:hypothetical protein